jgi:hypothetical protein
MGTWGAGNLDNDYAGDELSDRGTDLIKTLWARAKDKKSREGDEYDYTTLFVEFEIAFALESHSLLRSGFFPTPEEVKQLKQEYLAEWEPYYRRLGGNSERSEEHLQERRKCIAKTFDRFRRICAKHQRQKGH